MPVTITTSSPLEQLLKKSAAKDRKFPRRSGKYFEHYVSMKQHLADKYYAVTGAALAQQGDRYTKHDISHVDDVIAAAGQMLGCDAPAYKPAYKFLEPYEIFVLLLAILLHDAGNAVRRQGHERKAAEILREAAAASGLSDLEQRMISSIAQAHGGEMENGDKDTITGLMKDSEPHIGDIKVRAWLLAAILRFADELSENNTRADVVAIESPGTPDVSLLANYYCLLINPRIDFAGKSVHLAFHVDLKLLPRVFKVPRSNGDLKELMFIDYLAERLEKCERERRYCNRFLAGFASFDRIRVTLAILDNGREVDTVPLDLEEVGYPSLSKTIKELEPRFDACTLRDKHRVAAQQEQVS